MSLILDGTTGVPVTTVTGTLPVANGGTGGSTSTGTGAVVLTTSPTISAPTLSGPTISAPVLSGTATGTYTLGGTPTITAPTISAPVLSGTTTGTYTLGGTPTISSPTLVTPALGTPASGTLTNCTGVAAAALPAGSVLQVVSTTKTDTTSVSAYGYTDIPGMTVTITPSSVNSKILISFSINVGCTNHSSVRLMRGSTPIVGNAGGGARTSSTGANGYNGDNAMIVALSGEYLDSPTTTSATVYKLQGWADGGANPLYVNRSVADYDSWIGFRTISTITVMEIKG